MGDMDLCSWSPCFTLWIVCSPLRVFFWWLNCLLNFASFFILGLNFVNFIPGLNNLCSHHRTCGMGHWWLTTCELSAQLWDFYWWLNCLLNFEIFIDGWIVCSTLRVFLFWPQILFLASMICVPIREHGSHLWVVCSTLRVFLISDLSFEIKFVNLKVGQTCPKLSKPVHKTPHDNSASFFKFLASAFWD